MNRSGIPTDHFSSLLRCICNLLIDAVVRETKERVKSLIDD